MRQSPTDGFDTIVLIRVDPFRKRGMSEPFVGGQWDDQHVGIIVGKEPVVFDYDRGATTPRLFR